jgi:hypothetical protein
MTAARRPDGSGGPLGADERIDDIQFYVSPDADLLIDDIILYEAAVPGEARPFPRRVAFTGWFDTGEQGEGKEWPGSFTIVPHREPFTWDAAQGVQDPRPGAAAGSPNLRLGLRGERPVGTTTAIRFRYFLDRAVPVEVALPATTGRAGDPQPLTARTDSAAAGEWREATVQFPDAPPGTAGRTASEIEVRAPGGGALLVDDVLLFEP